MTLSMNKKTLYTVLGGLAFAAALAVGVLVGRMAGAPGDGAGVPSVQGGDVAPPNAVADTGIPTVPVAATDPAFDALPRIEIAAAFERFSSGGALFVDNRVKSEYDLGHVAGAISMPENEVAARFAELPKDKDLIFYCA